MLYYAKLYLLTIPVFFAIDMIWLGDKPLNKKFRDQVLGFSSS